GPNEISLVRTWPSALPLLGLLGSTPAKENASVIPCSQLRYVTEPINIALSWCQSFAQPNASLLDGNSYSKITVPRSCGPAGVPPPRKPNTKRPCPGPAS